ncbi:TetR/AcrR family transcriptional regulator [Gordonia sp. ABSL11-1]|uniref:TetR/AcrR family transcriptional regulator n=1 Tax=Gordonia sp. ABSL11-1 TaxID=3053924 RepID=UPI00257378B8|nr:TetR/AcrR family transcriptional regulator [Gordonia sp. ABSL11-1]MDL9948411.1 TetR/AcrR family transcriptional regulator [Gordonia sp. ABSL11-1]
MATRRRGADLEAAIHAAVQSELMAHGYAQLTFEGVAAAAETSKAVLYRRWPTKASMVFASMVGADSSPLHTPDTGSLVDDLTQLLRDGNELFMHRGRGMILGILSGADETTAQAMREVIFRRSADVVGPIVEHARARGELGPSPIPTRALALPMDLLRNETLLRRSLDDAGIAEIVGVCVVPLFRALSSADAGEGPP